MNYALILAGGVGQRMRNSGMPKQFLKVFNKPIIIYTLEKFHECQNIEKIVIACNPSWIEYMSNLINKYEMTKVIKVIPGGKDRQNSIENGLNYIEGLEAKDEDILVIHDGVRPLVKNSIIVENIRIAKKHGCAMTVRPVIESVIVTSCEKANFDDFKKREDTYSLTSPQTFQLALLKKAYCQSKGTEKTVPFLDAALAYTNMGNAIYIVKDNNQNIKITTPEDYYMLKAMLELEENMYVFGL